MKVKEESEKIGLKLNIQKTKIMASGPITLWQIDGETMETVIDFILGGSKITADGDCSHEIKRQNAWRAMDGGLWHCYIWSQQKHELGQNQRKIKLHASNSWEENNLSLAS